MKKNKVQDELQSISFDLTRSFARWNAIYKKGCQDPNWPDGCNLNLLRNHIIYNKRRIEEILENEHGLGIRLEIPQSYWTPTPEIVDEEYFADPQSERAIRIMNFYELKESAERKPEATQLELFAVKG